MPTSTKPNAVLTKLRKICASLPDFTEGAHSKAIAFKTGDAMFATYRAVGDDSEIVFALEPDHIDAVVDSDPRFKRYPRAPALVIRGSDIDDWGQMTDFLHESCKLAAAMRKPKSRRPAAKRKAPRKR